MPDTKPLEWVVGTETHSSNWGKFYVKGLEPWGVREEHDANRRDSHHNYQFWMATVPDDTVFTIFEQSGNKRGTDTWVFIILKTDSSLDGRYEAAYGDGFVRGGFAEIARASGNIKAPRLMNWWQAKPASVDALSYAYHCAEHIGRRGVAVLPPIKESQQGVIER